jgi:hypothetical protein
VRPSILVAIAFLAAADGRPARAADAAASGRAADQTATLKTLVKDGERASARHDWDAAARDYGDAAKLAPDDAHLRAKLRRALERRVRACEARAARPPPLPPPAMSDGPQDGAMVTVFKVLRWHLQLKREALEARVDAEAARERPDAAKIARWREAAAALRKDEQEAGAGAAREQAKDEASRKEGEKAFDKAFEGIGGVDPDQIKSGALR